MGWVPFSLCSLLAKQVEFAAGCCCWRCSFVLDVWLNSCDFLCLPFFATEREICSALSSMNFVRVLARKIFFKMFEAYFERKKGRRFR